MESVARELGGASDIPRMMSTPEPEPLEFDEPLIEGDSDGEDDTGVSRTIEKFVTVSDTHH